MYSWQIQLLETMKFDLDFQEMEVPNGDSNAAKKLGMGEMASYNLTTSCEVLSLSPSGGWLEQRHETLLQLFLFVDCRDGYYCTSGQTWISNACSTFALLYAPMTPSETRCEVSI